MLYYVCICKTINIKSIIQYLNFFMHFCLVQLENALSLYASLSIFGGLRCVCVCVIMLSLSNLQGNWMQWNLTVMTALHGFVSDISCFVSPSLPTVIGQCDSMSQKLTINITAEVKGKFVVTWVNGGLLMQTNSRQNRAQMQPGVPNAAVSLLCCISG